MSHAMTTPSSSPNHNNINQRRQGLSKALTKGLVLCWAVVVLEIWFSAEEEEIFDRQHEHHHHHRGEDPQYDLLHEGFGAPGRENSLIETKFENSDQFVIDGVALNHQDVNGLKQQYMNAGGENDVGGVPATQPNKGDHNNEATSIPEALIPSKNDTCCIPAIFSHKPKDVRCYGTCFTERACIDQTYPYSSAEERALYPIMGEVTRAYRKELRQECMRPPSFVPPTEWCQQPNSSMQKNASSGEVYHLIENIPPTGCGSISGGSGSGAFQNMIIFPSAKLAFCGIPKVGITQWIQFLRFIIGANDYPSWPHAKMEVNFFRFDKLDPTVQKRIWDDESWTFAAFLRDPAERALSAFLDKFETMGTNLKKTYGIDERSSFTFQDFIDRLSQQFNSSTCEHSGLNGLNWCSDPHWRPQVYSCGMSERLDRFQFIGDIENTAEHSRELLQHVGLWEPHGKLFVNDGVKVASHKCSMKPIFSDDLSLNDKPRHLGFQQRDVYRNATAQNTAYGHSRGSKNKMDQYYSPELLKYLREELYATDYKLWKLVHEKKGLSDGKMLAAQLSSKCQRLPVAFNKSMKQIPGSELELLNSTMSSWNSRVTNFSAIDNTSATLDGLHPDMATFASVPAALTPITSEFCCIPASYKSNPSDLRCKGTCFTERACNDTSYPFSSADEKAMYPTLDNRTQRYKQDLRRECQYPPSLVPPMEWCQTPNNEQHITNETITRIIPNIPPMGCGTGAFQNLLIFPSAKLAFCGIPKVGITQWIQFLRFIAGAKDYPSVPHYKADVSFFRFNNLDPSVQKRIWEDEGWTFAAFLREPAERLLSAYLDKVGEDGGRFFKNQGLNETMTLEKLIDFLARPENATSCDVSKRNGLTWCSDPHWRPQVFSCGMSERLDRFQFIGNIENAADHARELLEHVGLWNTYGKKFVHGGEMKGKGMCRVKPITLNELESDRGLRHLGFQQKGAYGNISAANTAYNHSRGSKSKVEEYFTPDMLKFVREKLYGADFKLWELVSRNSKLSRGKELASKISSICSLDVRSSVT